MQKEISNVALYLRQKILTLEKTKLPIPLIYNGPGPKNSPTGITQGDKF